MKKVGLFFILGIPCISLATDQSPYVGEELRAIKSLSEQEIESLRNGEGMGFAKLAELNHFPGPIHVLEVSDRLGLTSSQMAATTSLFEEMRVNAVALGEELLAAELQLDQDFETESITSESLENALFEIGNLRARLRYIHLESHLQQKKLLTPKQIITYDKLRGYHSREHDHVEYPVNRN